MLSSASESADTLETKQSAAIPAKPLDPLAVARIGVEAEEAGGILIMKWPAWIGSIDFKITLAASNGSLVH